MKKGFTMIELIFVIVILGVLAAVAIPKLNATRDDAEVAKAATNLATLVGDLTSYYTSKGHFEDDLSVMTNVPLANIVKKVPKLSASDAVTAVSDSLRQGKVDDALTKVNNQIKNLFEKCVKTEKNNVGDTVYSLKTADNDDTATDETGKPTGSFDNNKCNQSTIDEIGGSLSKVNDKIAGQGAAADYMIKNAKCATFTVNINSGAIDIAIDAAASKICLRAFEQNASTYGLTKPVKQDSKGEVKVIGSSVKF